MPKMNTYANDSIITDNDKWIGTDTDSGDTKNFTAQKVKEYSLSGLSKSDVLGIDQVDNTSDADKPISNNTQSALDGKVDKVTGKGLSDENYTLAEKNKLSNIEENYTTLEKDKLSNIEAGAQVNRNFGLGTNEVRRGDHVHFAYDVIYNSYILLPVGHYTLDSISIVVDHFEILTITPGFDGQQLTIFAISQNIDLTNCPDIEANITEITVGSNMEMGSATFIFLDGLWRLISHVSYS